MDINALFFTLAILVFVGMYLYTPLVDGRARRVSKEEHELSTLLAERDRVLNSLQELDFDFKLGKIPGEDYPLQRASLLQKGADILRKLDDLTPDNTQLETETRIERASAERRADTIPVASVLNTKRGVTDDDLESMIAARHRTRKEKSAGFCPNCGKPVLVSDRFCPACGRALT
ncbi:MAG: zinc-ribbon domain-containing protein [Chloroflexota bacterium]|nr:zinc-ribbon domain-containing protein [Chloroflexota bacterium]